MKMPKVSSTTENRSVMSGSTANQFGSRKIGKEKRQFKSSQFLMVDKENTPPTPAMTRSKSRTIKSINKTELIPSSKASSQQQNEVKRTINRPPLKPLKAKPVLKGAETCRMSLHMSPIHISQTTSKSGRKELSPTLLLEETEDYDIASISHIVFRRRSSNTIQKESCMLKSENPPLEYWRMLAEERQRAIEKIAFENEQLHDQISVIEADNSQLKEMVEQAKEILMIIQSSL